jgi:very-short-patch-repair endonuclease
MIEKMSEIDFYHKPNYIRNLSKKLRKEQTKAEELLWERLKAKQCA